MEKPPVNTDESWTPEDIESELADTEPELLKYFKLLPKQLWGQNFAALQNVSKKYEGEDKAVLAEKRINYILNVVQSREKAIVEYDIRESSLKAMIESSPQGVEGFGKTLRELLVSNEHTLGSGTTARVKRLDLESVESIAVKYLLTPNAKTLSAQGEYDMLREVEVITQIEEAEQRIHIGEYIRVPHPYFYYKRGALQCYGMSEVKGITLEQLTDTTERYFLTRDTILQSLKNRFASEDSRSALRQEADKFIRAVHEVCLHGDIKPGNIMLDEKGILYLIDFGQSVSVNAMSEETKPQFENIQERDRGQLRECIEQVLHLIQTPEERVGMAKAA